MAKKHAHAKPSCAQLGSDGRLQALKAGAHGTCTPTKFVTATGTTAWVLKLKHALPKGSYVAISRATDLAGHIETPGSADRISFQVI